MKTPGQPGFIARLLIALSLTAITLVAVPAPASAVADPTACPGITDSIDRLYSAYFLRAPESDGFAYWVDEWATGRRDLPGISSHFEASTEFDELYGDLTDQGFVELLYQNVLGRAGDSEGVGYWTTRLQTDTRGTIMLLFAESPEFVQTTGTQPPLAGYYSWPAADFTFKCPPAIEFFVLTDSVMLGMGAAYRDTIKSVPNRLAGDYRLTFDGRNSKWAENRGAGCRPISAGPSVLSEFPDRLDGIVVLGLGYNQFNDTDYKPAIDTMLAMSSEADLIVLVTLREAGVFSLRYPRTNDYMRQVAAENDKVIIADWAAFSGGRDDLTYDGLHLTPIGAALFADLLLGSIQAAGVGV